MHTENENQTQSKFRVVLNYTAKHHEVFANDKFVNGTDIMNNWSNWRLTAEIQIKKNQASHKHGTNVPPSDGHS